MKHLLLLSVKLYNIRVEFRHDGHSLDGISTCLIPVYSLCSSEEWFPVSVTVSHLSVKQLGLKSNTVYFDSHKTLSGWRWDGEGWYEKTLFATDTTYV